MWCLISQPNSVVFEVRVDPKAIGQECLEKACEYLGITHEADYFGLKYENSRGEELWLNLRNPIDRQVNCHAVPLRFSLRVKFWIPPHLLLQDTTKHQFYLNAKHDLLDKSLLVDNWETVSYLIALIAQAEEIDYDPIHPPHTVYLQTSTISAVDCLEKPQDLLHKIIEEHKRLKGGKRSTAEYWLLKAVSEQETFGEERFHAVTKQHPHESLSVGVGPHGISISSENKEKQLITFSSVISASSQKRNFRFGYLLEDGSTTELEVKLDSSHLASGLYRALTEKHAFYSCETVTSAVMAQCIRDLKGIIVSIFNEDSNQGKKYVFDIRRTCREVYDGARRAIYQENNLQSTEQSNTKCQDHEDNCKDSQEKYLRLLDSMLCKICMDSQIDTAFLPCGHVLACNHCALRCDKCPICRTDIKQSQKLFLPVEFRTTERIEC
ncbi:E3 ubiquitin-protein ligase MYLIP [Harmonia axyridis]|uniref:E3 ubiquitin-protein ligase MYLIP n=1 Tax=Harmonia axyridis TaxID=115357 RepID=UPI001E276A55|nr:E3 ubiquitin-protein ligase MYLIP [Harmonia axyridis]